MAIERPVTHAIVDNLTGAIVYTDGPGKPKAIKVEREMALAVKRFMEAFGEIHLVTTKQPKTGR